MISLIDDAYKVVRADHVLFSGVPAATLTLTGSLPSVPFRCEVATAGAGTVVVGSESLVFAAAGRKRSTVDLVVLPTITTSGLTGTVTITAIQPSGAPLQIDTLTAIKIRMKTKTKSIPSPTGGWQSIRESYALSWAADGVVVGDIIRYDGQDHTVSAVEKLRGFASSELVRKLMF